MPDVGGAEDVRCLVSAEALGLAMARRARDILERHRAALTGPDGAGDPAQRTADDAIFTAVLDATSDCLAELDPGDPEDRWGDALLHLLLLARPPAGP